MTRATGGSGAAVTVRGIDPGDLVEEQKRVDTAIGFIRAAGFTFPEEMIKNYYICLKTKPFVILAGISGTGKTQITRLLAKAFAAHYDIVPVSSHWDSDEDLLGTFDAASGKHVDTRFTRVIRAAHACWRQKRDELFFVCLDEMNLARVEHYFARFLSAMEGSTPEERRIHLDGGETLNWPPNLFFVGTVNMDETTYAFSDKVLDRANSIEFGIDVNDLFQDSVKSAPPDPLPYTFGQLERFRRSLDHPGVTDVARRWRGEIVDIWKLLEPHHFHFGFRVRDEIELYLLNSQGLLEEKMAFDMQVKQKILPKLYGRGDSMKLLLTLLQDHLIDRGYRLSAKKVEEMKHRLIRDDFTAYYPGQLAPRRAGALRGAADHE